MKKETKDKRQKLKSRNLLAFVLIFGILLSLNLIFAATPEKPGITSINNSTWATSNNGFFNISGGYISTINLDATFQNTRWKAFVGNVTGKYTLDDAAGQTIFDWTFATLQGRVYSTRDSGTVEWGSIGCADATDMNNENSALCHSNISTDNLTRTFNRTDHTAFYAAGTYIGTNVCNYGVTTYVNDAPQDTDFEEIVLHDGTSIVYATIMENNAEGYDTSKTFDFQMIVPENASAQFGNGATPYYVYVELD